VFEQFYRRKCVGLQTEFVQQEQKKAKDDKKYQPRTVLPMVVSLKAFLLDTTATELCPNIELLAVAALTVCVDSTDCERGFSAMKHIKTALRNRLAQSTLEQLLMISINGPELDEKEDVQQIIEEALAFWYGGKSGKTGAWVKRRVKLPGVVAKKPANVVWGESYSASAEGKAVAAERRVDREAKQAKKTTAARELKAATDKKNAEKKKKEIEAQQKQDAKKAEKKAAKKAKKKEKKAKNKQNEEKADSAEEQQDQPDAPPDAAARSADAAVMAGLVDSRPDPYRESNARGAELAQHAAELELEEEELEAGASTNPHFDQDADTNSFRPQAEEWKEFEEKKQQHQQQQHQLQRNPPPSPKTGKRNATASPNDSPAKARQSKKKAISSSSSCISSSSSIS
jgi:hypothetical protein